jgi:hypothetical protein
VSKNENNLSLQQTSEAVPSTIFDAGIPDGGEVALAPHDLARLAVMAAAVQDRMVELGKPARKEIPYHLLLAYLIRLHGLDEDVIDSVAEICALLTGIPLDVLDRTSAALNVANRKRERVARLHGLSDA